MNNLTQLNFAQQLKYNNMGLKYNPHPDDVLKQLNGNKCLARYTIFDDRSGDDFYRDVIFDGCNTSHVDEYIKKFGFETVCERLDGGAICYEVKNK